MKLRFFLPLVSLILVYSPSRAQNEIGFIERFSLGSDREKVLSELIPGTEEYYFFHALHYQNSRQAAKLAAVLDEWKKRWPNSPQRNIIENREALLAYDANPERTLAFLRDHFHLRFDHVQESRDRKPDLPSQLDPATINRSAYLREALQDDALAKCTPEALAQLVSERVQLRPAQRRVVLDRLERPNVPGLIELIAEDLRKPESAGFGQHPIERQLLPAQLDQLQKLRPEVAQQSAFVFARLRHLAPSVEEDVEFDSVAREAWLDRTWAYIKSLPPAFNSLKAALLYQRLEHDRRKSLFDEARFIEYLKLPRPVSYAAPRWTERLQNANTAVADLSASFGDIGAPLPAINNDESLVRDYLLHLFGDNPKQGWELFSEWVSDKWLKPIYAEALLVRGLGNAEQLASMLPAADYQRLTERVDLDFLLSNSQFLAPGDDVRLEAAVKNAPKLIVKVYELNALNYFLTTNKQLNTDLPLDGLVANAETTHTFEEPPIRRVQRTFNFPELKGRRGAWMIELIGGGRSSRALIRKGQWHVVQHTGAGGDLLTVLDEHHAPVPDATVWLNGRQFTAKSPGPGRPPEILIPFTTQPGRKPLILADAAGTFATLSEFEHHSESYQLDAQFYLEREQLLAGRDADLNIRTALRLHDAVLPLALLRDAKLTVTTKSLDGIETTRDLKDLKLDPNAVFTYHFPVPPRLAAVAVNLTGKVPSLLPGASDIPVSAGNEWELNGLDRTDATFDGHLIRSSAGYTYELLGKNGEPIADKQVVFEIQHSAFIHHITVPLGTDARGRISLGALPDIVELRAKLPNGQTRTENLVDAVHTSGGTIQVRAGEPIEIPLTRPADRVHTALLETRDAAFVSDRSANITFAETGELPFLRVKGLAPGDYTLLLPSESRRVSIRVTSGTPALGWVLGGARYLEQTSTKPLRIAGLALLPDSLVVTLANTTPHTRVHVVGTRFVPSDHGLLQLAGSGSESAGQEIPARLPNLFAGGRDIGDEYRYILERRYALKFPGNMLARPGILLNPWAKRTTDQSPLDQKRMQAAGATMGGRAARSPSAAGAPPAPRQLIAAPESSPGTNLDYLEAPAPLFLSLSPDKEGVIRIERAKLGDASLVQVLATDLDVADWREVTLPETPPRLRDLRLTQSFDPAKPFAEKKRFTVLAAGQTFTLADRSSSEFEAYDTLGSVFSLYQSLNKDATLAQFGWVLNWPTLSAEQKRAKYSEFACHELNLFLARKDPAFFQAIIQPYLRNKRDRTFLDDYLIGDDLKGYLEPWRFGQLNAAERALLASRLPAEAKNIARHLREQWELLPVNPDEQDRLFETALRGRAMDEEHALGVAALTPAPAPAVAAATPAPQSANRPAIALEMGIATKSRPLSSAVAKKAEGFADRAISQENKAVADEMSPGKPGLLTPEEADLQRQQAKENAYYRRLGPTKEWAENNYFHLPITEQGPELIPVNAFWRDYAEWAADGGKAPFLSPNVGEAHHNFAEMILALAVLDLPFEAPKHDIRMEGAALTLRTRGPVILVHKEIRPAVLSDGPTELLVSQNFYRHGDRYRQEGNEKSDKYVTDEFLAGAVYGANVVVTNPTSSPQKLELLLQIPKGALPVLGAKATDSRRVRLEPFTTHSFEYAFYFPAPPTAGGKFPHYPVQVAAGEKIVGAAKPFAFPVVSRLAQADKASWDYVSQYSDDADVFAFLEQQNIARLDLGRIAWRCRRDADFYRRLIALLHSRHRYDPVIYSYSVAQRDGAGIREWLLHLPELTRLCGDWFESSLVSYHPTERRDFEHLEYSPLVNQRAHRLGSEYRIANNVVLQQYQRYLRQLAHKPSLTAGDSLTIVGFLFLQDRVEEALARLKGITPESLATRLQYDYFRCYAAMYEADLAGARGIANQYAEHPVERWRNLFREVIAQLDEIEGKSGIVKVGNEQPSRERDTAALAGRESTYELKVENKNISLTWKNLSEVTINYYLIDPEFSFSSNPFVSADAGRSSVIKPTKTAQLKLPPDKNSLELPLPAEFTKANVLVEAVAAGQRLAQAYHANTLTLTVAENYGRLEVRDQASTKPVPKAYVKVYARLRGGTVRFFKDGYTDLRGKFDYASLNSSEASRPVHPVPQAESGSLDTQMLRPDEVGEVDRLAVLVLSDANGAVVREVSPPRE